MNNIMQKTYDKSYFVSFERGSELGNTIFNINRPFITEKVFHKETRVSKEHWTTEQEEIIVLQVMPCDNDVFLCEVINKTDYEGLIKEEDDEEVREQDCTAHIPPPLIYDPVLKINKCSSSWAYCNNDCNNCEKNHVQYSDRIK